ncbi:MAG TPA: hypothetical protein VH394_12110 [Thermoanaerobaculia bacterium]|jgi:hypothetical protein|nr:hypothetical protein [Thermoanaerobaculia bacterium]
MGKILLAVLAAAGLLRPDLPTRPGFEPAVSLDRSGRAIEHLDGLLRLPPLIAPGETIEIAPLNPARTPAGGRWTVAGVEAKPVDPAEDTGLRLRVQLPTDLDPMGPLPVVYTDARGQRIVEASGLEQVRVVPPSLPSTEPRLSRCGSQWVQDGVACACGWFPDQAARDALRIDGRPVPAGSLAAVSHRSVCARVGLGPHLLPGGDKVVAVQIRRFPPFLSLRPLQSTAITWMVLGTKDPVRLRLRNTAPDLATLEGGTLQTAATSGGLRNAASRNVTWLAGSGPFRIEAEVEDDTAPFLGEEYLTLLGEHFQREVRRVAAGLDEGVRALPEERGLYPRGEVLSLLAATRSDLDKALPYPELAAFRDATADLLDEAAARVQLLPEEETAQVEKKKIQPLLKRVQAFLESSGESPRRSLCILSSPEDGAIVKIYPRSLPSDPVETSTADIVSHLFPGKYRYEVWKDSFKEVESEIDLTGDTRLVLDCRLIPAGDRNEPAPCRLASASERDAARCRWP